MINDTCRFYLLTASKFHVSFEKKMSDTPTGGKTRFPNSIPSQVDFQMVSKLWVGNVPTYKDFVLLLHNKSDGVLNLTAHADFNRISDGPEYEINLR